MTRPNTAISNTTNILAFPENRIVRGKILSKADFNDDIAEHKIKFIDFLLAKNMSMLYTKLGLEGLDTETEQFYKDYSFTVETLRSAIYRSLNLGHPIQDFVDEHFKIDESAEPPKE